MKQCWLKCKLSRGLYPDDFMVRIPDSKDHNHDDVCLFASKDVVQSHDDLPEEIDGEINGRLRVILMDHAGMSAVVQLPTDEHGDQRIIAVPKNSVQIIKHSRLGFTV